MTLDAFLLFLLVKHLLDKTEEILRLSLSTKLSAVTQQVGFGRPSGFQLFSILPALGQVGNVQISTPLKIVQSPICAFSNWMQTVE